MHSLIPSSATQSQTGKLVGALIHWDGIRLTTLGLYTSPHLVAVRERIRINGSPLSEQDFTNYFYQVWDRLQENTTVGLSCCYIHFFG